MSTETKREKDWTGDEILVTYKDGEKVSVTRHQPTWSGSNCDVTYSVKTGDVISRTYEGKDWTGESNRKTYSTNGTKIATTYERDFLIGNGSITVDGSGNVSKSQNSPSLWGGDRSISDRDDIRIVTPPRINSDESSYCDNSTSSRKDSDEDSSSNSSRSSSSNSSDVKSYPWYSSDSGYDGQCNMGSPRSVIFPWIFCGLIILGGIVGISSIVDSVKSKRNENAEATRQTIERIVNSVNDPNAEALRNEELAKRRQYQGTGWGVRNPLRKYDEENNR